MPKIYVMSNVHVVHNRQLFSFLVLPFTLKYSVSTIVLARNIHWIQNEISTEQSLYFLNLEVKTYCWFTLHDATKINKTILYL